jgi:D-aminopeptidase
MTTVDLAAVTDAMNLLPNAYRGPAGVAGVVKDGQVIASRAWGFADMYRHQPMTSQTRLPICSISKQMTCALLLDLFGTPEALDPLLPALLPRFQGALPSVATLCHNKSGLRDYWAETVLQGAVPEGLFTREDGLRLLAQTKTGHFAPGANYSYSNGNFRLLADLIERASGRDFGTLLQERIFAPAGMHTAELAPDTRVPLDGVLGYEGNDEVGFLPAQSGIFWYGDAGISASLNDMLAWECHIDATRDDPDSLYNRISAPVSFADGTAAAYGYGLRRDSLAGYQVTGHGGGLRGFTSFRLHVAAERLSVVVMFNHEAAAMRAAWSLMEAALGCQIAAPAGATTGWDGLWLDETRGLVVTTQDSRAGVRLGYAPSPALLHPLADGSAQALGISLRRDQDRLIMERLGENLRIDARPLQPLAYADGTELAGRYHSDEIEADLEIQTRDGASYALFHGMLGTGPMERMYPVARDIWVITTRRAMDASAPGDWTLCLQRDATGRITGLTLGCWLARAIRYQATGT